MKTNPDGTLLCAETISEIIAERFNEAPFPQFCNVIGADALTNFPTSSDHYRELVLATARNIYPDDGGHLVGGAA